jgi:hypothetical protein
MSEGDDDELLDFMDYPKINADGVADVYNTNGRTYAVLFEFRKFEGKLRRVVVGEVVLPTSAKQQWLKPPNEEEPVETRTKH